MTNIFEVLELVCLFLNIASLVVIGIGWLTCADYYYSSAKFAEGLPLFMHVLFSIGISIASIVIGLTFDGFGKAPYVHLGYFTIVLIITLAIFIHGKIMDLRQYFADKRGRRI